MKLKREYNAPKNVKDLIARKMEDLKKVRIQQANLQDESYISERVAKLEEKERRMEDELGIFLNVERVARENETVASQLNLDFSDELKEQQAHNADLPPDDEADDDDEPESPGPNERLAATLEQNGTVNGYATNGHVTDAAPIPTRRGRPRRAAAV